MRSSLLFVVALSLLDPAAGRAQGAPQAPVRATAHQQSADLGRLSGRVFAADTGKPLRRAVVQISPPNATLPQLRAARSVSTDADGRWEITRLAPGRYEVAVSRGGYVTLRFGQTRPFQRGTIVDVDAGRSLDRLDVTLPRAGAIEGHVTDEGGDPLTHAVVSVMRVRYTGGVRTLAPATEGMMALFTGGLTDDLGRYRIYGLTPGTYFVSATFASDPAGRSEDAAQYAPTFYPGTSTATEAQSVAVAVGRDVSNVNFSLRPVRVARVSGVAITSSGAPLRGRLTLRPLSGAGVSGAEHSTGTEPNGTFAIPNVPAGDYVLQAESVTRLESISELASFAVTVAAGQDISNLTVPTTAGARIAGRVRFDDDSQAAIAPGMMSVRAAAADQVALTAAGTDRSSVSSDGGFALRGLLGRHVIRLAHAPEDLYLSSVIHNGQDIVDTGHDFRPGESLGDVDLVVTRRAAVLEGTVVDERSQRVAQYSVIVFSADPTRWSPDSRYIRAALPNLDGTFTLKGLPSDDYFVVALEDLESGEEFARERLEQWRASATRVSLTTAESKSLSLKLVR